MFWILFKQDFKNLLHNPGIVFLATVYPVVLILLFGYLFADQYAHRQTTSYDYYGITMVTFLVAGAVTVTPNAFMERKIKQPNLRIAYAPVSHVTVYLSKIISSFFFIAIGITTVMCVCNAIGLVNFGGEKILYSLLLIWSLLLFVCMLGAAVCVTLKSEEMTNKILSLTMNALSIMAGTFFPIAMFGKTMTNLSQLSPITWINRALFQIVYDNNTALFYPVFIALLLASLILVGIVHKKYQPQDFLIY